MFGFKENTMVRILFIFNKDLNQTVSSLEIEIYFSSAGELQPSVG
jgi:hypothetical protein